ncbi:MAG TPA: NmrA family transcriptional regulator, partial [Alphaproteobacteria bacterium]|nr:NmrA family transcriptional regulator [Alphaproteobacteria bacterium]
GTERLQASGYFRAKLVQERLIAESGTPYTIVRATQFFEFAGGIVYDGTVGDAIHMSPALFQPIAAEDVADAVADATLKAPRNGMIEIGGPAKIPLDEFVRQFLAATHDGREVVTDIHARYFGIDVNDRTLTPDAGAHLGAIHFEDWLSQNAGKK